MHLYEFINLTYNYDTLLNLLSEKKDVNKIEIIYRFQNRCQNMLVLNSYENYLLYYMKIYKVIKDQKRRKKNCSSTNDLVKRIFFQNLYAQ